MTSTTRILAGLFALALFPGGNASFAYVHDRRSNGMKKVIGGFRQNFGWPGYSFPADPWGIVMGNKAIESSSSVGGIPGSSVGVAGVAANPSTEVSLPPAYPTAIPFPTLSYTTTTASTPLVTASSVSHNSTLSIAIPTFSVKINSTSTFSKPTSTPPKESTDSSASTSSFEAPPETTKHTTTQAQAQTQTQAKAPPEPKPTTSSPPQPASAGAGGQGSDSTSGPTSNADIQAYLTAHNSIRAQHGAAPLTYSQDLAAKAQSWANGCIFKHSGGSLGPFGENLAAGTGGGYGIPQAIKSWTDEVSQYNPNNPQASHFTQVVWKGSTQVGCALQNCNGIFDASFGKAHFYVCEYSPAGNVIGSFAKNVQV